MTGLETSSTRLSIRGLRVRVPSASLNRSSRKIKTCGYCRFTSQEMPCIVWGHSGGRSRVTLRPYCEGN